MHYDSKGMQCENLKLLQCGDQQVNQLVGWTRDSPDTQVDGFTPMYTTLSAVRLAVVTIGKTFNFPYTMEHQVVSVMLSATSSEPLEARSAAPPERTHAAVGCLRLWCRG